MKKYFDSLYGYIVVFIISLVIVLCTIGMIRYNIEVKNSDKVFVLVYEDLKNDIDIYVHIDTKVMYMCDSTNKSRVFEIMLDEFGKPLLYNGDL